MGFFDFLFGKKPAAPAAQVSAPVPDPAPVPPVPAVPSGEKKPVEAQPPAPAALGAAVPSEQTGGKRKGKQSHKRSKSRSRKAAGGSRKVNKSRKHARKERK